VRELEEHGVMVDRIVVTTAFDHLLDAERDALLDVERSSGIRLEFIAERLGLEGPAVAHPGAGRARQESGHGARWRRHRNLGRWPADTLVSLHRGENDAAVMHNSALINLNILEACLRRNSKRIFYSSSACIYPEHQQRDPHKISLPEDCAPVPFPPHTSPEMHSLDHR